ncbi:sulfotransferase [Mesorhizobium sp. B2-8-3]|uniref:sulfotransferase family protein n=1 Tax=Mesorhizobium sp. B2-8-3 TaxID=2589905 RepID=UPI001126121E|nr:sulfotransferase [Mesorhizobium sp. B2-8-3]TPJ29991.1 sulfotransferase [Mesorhizobium sp. B2-8-3]
MGDQSTSSAGLRTNGTDNARRVNLFGVGAPRTATSSLAAMLAKTQQVFVPEEKEVNGFGITPELTEALYDLRFADARARHRYIADISPIYFSNERVPARIKSYNPDAKIIVTLREPISRIVSQYSHMRRQTTDDASLAPDLQLDVNGYIRKGLFDLQAGAFKPNSWYSAALNITHSFYGRNLARFRDCFASEQILVLIYEDLLQPRWFWQRGRWHKDLQSFLGVKVNERAWENRATDERLTVAQDLVAELKDLFAPEIRIAAEFVGRNLPAVWGY